MENEVVFQYLFKGINLFYSFLLLGKTIVSSHVGWFTSCYSTVLWLLDGLLVSEYNFEMNNPWPDFDGGREVLDILEVLPIFFTWQSLKNELLLYFKNKTIPHHFTVHPIRPIISGFFLSLMWLPWNHWYIIKMLAEIGSSKHIHVRKTWKPHVVLWLKHWIEQTVFFIPSFLLAHSKQIISYALGLKNRANGSNLLYKVLWDLLMKKTNWKICWY